MGQVYFVAGIDEGTEYKPVPSAYLVNKNYDILCAFEPAWFHVSSRIYDVVFKDVNKDGLEDAVISTCFIDYNGEEEEEMPHVHWLFLQTDHWFKLDTVWFDREKARDHRLSVKDMYNNSK